ncbi:hypothetical protein FDP22_12650 [Paroceanicella profunda]|uniref:Uncharacterized protein n=1 Tax=Paroceanicella profunda TaxID=2579971 RepID=A0A5B8FHT1_9RHOB|nr:hypothetical protein [Paroceanicella profunda]QDL92557.1 hypothetical protein FDP22_12650 [Paroceanicella profunda]
MVLKKPAWAEGVEWLGSFIRNLVAAFMALAAVLVPLGMYFESKARDWTATVAVSAVAGELRGYSQQIELYSRSLEESRASAQASRAILKSSIDDLATALTAQNLKIASLEASEALSSDPVASVSEASVTDTRIGDRAVFDLTFRKYRACDQPQLSVSFTNGGGRTHMFRSVSIVNQDTGIALSAPTIPDRDQSIRFSATIPGDEGVEVGRGRATISVNWLDCPRAPDLRIGPMFFNIQPRA